MKNPVVLMSSTQSFEVDLLRAKLEEHNIGSYILNKQESVTHASGVIELYVEESNLEKAKQLIS